MFETPTELRDLQELLDSSLAGSTSHLRSIIRSGERTLSADQLVQVCRGMCTLAVATVTCRGEPRISGADGHLLHGRWIIGTHRSAAKARHLDARPATSVTYMRGEQLGIFVHGHATPLNPADAPSEQNWPEVQRYLMEHYGADAFPWDDVIFYRVDPTWMVAYSVDPAALLDRERDSS